MVAVDCVGETSIEGVFHTVVVSVIAGAVIVVKEKMIGKGLEVTRKGAVESMMKVAECGTRTCSNNPLGFLREYDLRGCVAVGLLSTIPRAAILFKSLTSSSS